MLPGANQRRALVRGVLGDGSDIAMSEMLIYQHLSLAHNIRSLLS
jgi:hypothetical protein